jgi:hypothetical protein
VKTCPDCAEEVQAAARVCKHCGYRFERPAAARKPILPLLGWAALAFAILAGMYFASTFLFGARFSVERYNAIEPGDSEAMVEDKLGEPDKTAVATVDDPRQSFIDADVWIYREDGDEYAVAFVDGAVAQDPEAEAP